MNDKIIETSMQELDKKIIELYKSDQDPASDVGLLKIEALLEEKLKDDPKNIQLWQKLALLEKCVPLVNSHKSIECAYKALELDQDNIITLLIMAFLQDIYGPWVYGAGLKEELVNKLVSIQAHDNELNSMLKYAASWYYSDAPVYEASHNAIIKEKLLKESIELCQSHVWNYVDLAQLYFEQNRKTDAKNHMEKGLKNIVKIYGITDDIKIRNPTDINLFLNERVKGIYITDLYFQSLCRKQKQYEENSSTTQLM
jgi:hypothetical protein